MVRIPMARRWSKRSFIPPLTMSVSAIAPNTRPFSATSSGVPPAFEISRTQTCSSTGMLRSEEHTSELQSRLHLVCRLLLEKKKNIPYHLVQCDQHELLVLIPYSETNR